MASLFLFFSVFDDLYYTLPRLFYLNRGALAQNGIAYHYTIDAWQAHAMSELGYRCGIAADPSADRATREHAWKILASRLKFLECARGGSTALVMDIPTAEGMRALKKWLSARYPDLDVHVTLVGQRQDRSFTLSVLRSWRNYTFEEVFSRKTANPRYLNYYGIFQDFRAVFGPSACSFVEYEGFAPAADAQARLAEDIAGILRTPAEMFEDQSPWRPPSSFPGLNISWATAQFPFTVRGKEVFDRQAFTALLRDVEKEENFLEFHGQPLRWTKPILDLCAPWNFSLASLLGRPLFSSAPAHIPEAPEEAPPLDPEQARPFVAAMDEKLRFALLRHFRDCAQPLIPCRQAFATALEEYRTRHGVWPGFRFPRPRAQLSVLTMTRNHRDFIAQCMESVAEQKTDFALEHIIVDDCSDDGTQDIIDDFAASHPHVRPVYLPWRSVRGENVRTLFNACKSPYAALCDGDDYFTDDGKLQLQVDFLKQNPACALCFHQVQVDFEGLEHKNFVYPPDDMLPAKGQRRQFYLGDLLKGNFIQTNSVVYRWRFQAGLPDWFRPDLAPGDWYWHLLHAETGPIGYIPRVMSVYRRHGNAFYNNAFLDVKQHRLQHGIKELETFSVLDGHFKGKYFKTFSSLANGVFANLLELQLETGNQAPLDEASEKFPQFALAFLNSLKIVSRAAPGPR